MQPSLSQSSQHVDNIESSQERRLLLNPQQPQDAFRGRRDAAPGSARRSTSLSPSRTCGFLGLRLLRLIDDELDAPLGIGRDLRSASGTGPLMYGRRQDVRQGLLRWLSRHHAAARRTHAPGVTAAPVVEVDRKLGVSRGVEASVVLHSLARLLHCFSSGTQASLIASAAAR